MIRAAVLAAALFVAALVPARAALAPAELEAVGLSPAPGAALPRDLILTEAGGSSVRLGDLLGRRPAVLVMADYRCREICGPILSIVAGALGATGLAAGRDYDLVVVGLDPRAAPADAARMGEAQLGGLASAAHLLSGSPAAVAAIEKALNYRAVYDEAAGRYAHPADVLVLTPQGAVSRLMPALSLDPATLRLTLVEAGEGRIGTLVDRLGLLCYGLDPAHGVANGAIRVMLAAGGALTLAGLGGFLLALSRRRASPGGVA